MTDRTDIGTLPLARVWEAETLQRLLGAAPAVWEGVPVWVM